MLSGIVAGSHEIKGIKGDFVGIKRVMVVADDLLREKIIIDQDKAGGLKVYSNPVNADIYIDGKLYGKTPKIIKNLIVGDHLVVLKKSKDLIYEQIVNVEYNKFAKIDCELKRYGALQLTSNPRLASIYINDQYKGKTNSSVLLFPTEKIKVGIKLKNYVKWEKVISLKEGEIKKIEVDLQREQGTIRFSSYPNGAELTVNNEKYEMKKSKIKLPVGFSNDIKISCPGYLDKKWKDVEVVADRTLMFDASLEKKTRGFALTRSVFVPGWGQGYQGKEIRAWLYGLSFFGTLGGGLYFTKEYNDAVIDYNEARNQYEQAADVEDIEKFRTEMTAQYDNINELEKKRNNLYIAAGAVWLWNIIDVLFLPPAWEGKVKASAYMNKDKVFARIGFEF